MNEEKTTKEEILSLAKNTKLYCELLIAQSESWSEAEEKQKAEKYRKPEIIQYDNYMAVAELKK